MIHVLLCLLLQAPKQEVPPDPELERKSFKVADGFEVTLFAADPLIAKPIQINFDHRGWVSIDATVLPPCPTVNRLVQATTSWRDPWRRSCVVSSTVGCTSLSIGALSTSASLVFICIARLRPVGHLPTVQEKLP